MFNYSGAVEHIEEHKKFGVKLAAIQGRYGADTLTLSFELVDFLEDWLVDHLITMDQKYGECFKNGGLK